MASKAKDASGRAAQLAASQAAAANAAKWDASTKAGQQGLGQTASNLTQPCFAGSSRVQHSLTKQVVTAIELNWAHCTFLLTKLFVSQTAGRNSFGRILT